MVQPRFGLAISPANLALAHIDRSGEAVRSCTLPPLSDDDEVWAEASRCLAALLLQPSPARARVSVVLLPPLVQVRRVDLPRLRDAELRQVLSRDTSRYFMAVNGAQVIGFRRVDRGSRGSAPVLAACAPAWLLRRIATLTTQLGWTLDAIAPAHAAWAAQAAPSTGDCQVVALSPGYASVVRVRSGHPDSGRQVPLRAEAVAAALQESPETSVVLLDGDAELSGRLTEAGFRVTRTTASVAEVAARGAGAARRLELVPADVVGDRYRWSVRVSRRIWLGTAALLALSVALARWDLARETGVVLDARSALRQQVATALTRRAQLDQARNQLVLMHEAEARAPRWTGVLGALAEGLPADAWLGSFRAAGDSVLLEGTADQASGAFEALQRSRILAGIRATAPIRQVSGEDETPVERFSLTARLRSQVDTAP